MESWFRTAPEGLKVFYPWGRLCKRGYVVGSERDYNRLRRLINLWMIIAGVSLALASRRLGYLAGCATLVFWSAFYFFWMRHVVRRLQPYNPSEWLF
jgi:hypothetical protein